MSDQNPCDSHNFSSSDRLLVFEYQGIEWETERAYKIKAYGAILWFPKSCTVVIKKHSYFTIPLWLAIKNGYCIEISKTGEKMSAFKKNGEWNRAEVVEWKRLVPDCVINFKLPTKEETFTEESKEKKYKPMTNKRRERIQKMIQNPNPAKKNPKVPMSDTTHNKTP